MDYQYLNITKLTNPILNLNPDGNRKFKSNLFVTQKYKHQ